MDPFLQMLFGYGAMQPQGTGLAGVPESPALSSAMMPTLAQLPAEPLAPPSLGAALEPGSVPLPRSRPAGLDTPTPETPKAATEGGTDAILKTLRGVQAPAAPVPQKVSTPNLPPLRPIQSGGLIEMLASLGIGPQQAMAGMKLPGTLGQALGGR